MDTNHHQLNEPIHDQNQRLSSQDIHRSPIKSSHDTFQSSNSQSDVLSERLDLSTSDFILPVTFLGIAVLGIVFVFVILIIWLKNYLRPEKNEEYGCKSQLPRNNILKIMEQYDTDDAGKSFKIEIVTDDGEKSSKKKKDDFEFKLPSSSLDITESKSTEAIHYVYDNQKTLSVVSTKNYGGSSPKLPENDNPKKEESGKPDVHNTKFVFPLGANSGNSINVQQSTSKGSLIESKCGKFKIAVPEQQWIFHQKAPLEYKGFSIKIPKPFPLAEAVKIEFGAEQSVNRPKTFSVTRSPSLEKDDKSPFISSAKSEKGCEFKFPAKKSESKLSVNSGSDFAKLSRNSSEDNVFVEIDNICRSKSKSRPVNKLFLSNDNFNINDKLGDRQNKHRKYSLNGHRSANSSLGICTVADASINNNFQPEKVEMQNSPRNIECTSAKELTTHTKFNFSPKQLCSSACETNTPIIFEVQKFFPADKQSPSPKLFTENQIVCSSPKVFNENHSRTSSPKPHSYFSSDAPKSPHCHSAGVRTPRSNKENYFIFDTNTRAPSPSVEMDNLNVNNRKTKEYVCNNTNRLEQPKLFKQNSFDISRSNDKNTIYNKQNSLDNTILCENNNSKPTVSIRSCLSDNIKRDGNIVLNNDKQSSVTSTESTHIMPICKTDNNNKHITSDEFNINQEVIVREIDHNELYDVEHPSLQQYDNDLIMPNTTEIRRQRLKSISLDSDNAKIIEQNLGLPIAKHLKRDDLTIPVSSCFEVKRNKLSCGNITPSIVINKETRFNFDQPYDEPELESLHYPASGESIQFSPNILSPKRRLMDAANTKSFTEMQPRFSPKEFEMTITEDMSNISNVQDKKIKCNKNLKNLTIDLSKKDSDLEKELLEFERLYSEAEKLLTPKTPTLKVKATSLDSSDTLNLSLPQKKTLDVPQNSISVPNTPKRQFKRVIGQKILKKSAHGPYNAKLNEISIGSKIVQPPDFRKPYSKSQNLMDSGIYLRENHANLMLYQGPKYSTGRVVYPANRLMGSFDENMVDLAENAPEINISDDNFEQDNIVIQKGDSSLLGSTLSTFKQNLSVSSTNLKTLPEGVPSNDFEPTADEKVGKKSILQRRGSNQSLTINLDGTQTSLKYSTLSLQGSNCSLGSFGMSSHNLASMKNSASNFSLNTDNRQKKNILERRNSNTSLTLNLDSSNLHIGAQRVPASCSFNVHPNIHEQPADKSGKKCLLQRRGSNNSLTLNIKGSNSNLNRFTSNSSLNINQDAKTVHRKSLLERRSSNTSLALNVTSGTQLSTNRGLSISNYNLNSSTCSLSRYNSNQSITITGPEPKKGLLERRSSNTSLTLNIQGSNTNVQSQEAPREIEIDVNKSEERSAESSRLAFASHRKSLSTENLLPKSYKMRIQPFQSTVSSYFGSHDELWSQSYASEMDDTVEQNLTYVGGDQENEMIYAFSELTNTHGFIRNITTKPLSPQTTSEDFKTYLANIQHLQNASNILTRQHLKDLNALFRNLYKTSDGNKNRKDSSSSLDALDKIGSVLQDLSLKPVCTSAKVSGNSDCKNSSALTCTDHQKSLLRSLHQEFWDLPTNFQEKPLVFGSHTKNRYKTILPNEHSRFILKPEFENGIEGYINANFIKGHEYSKNCYIATQGPLMNTVYDFWLMVYQNSCQFKQTCMKTNEDRHFGVPHSADQLARSLGNNLIQKIVMLTGFSENNRQKCEKYFPIEQGDEIEFNATHDRCLSNVSDNPFADSPITDHPASSPTSRFKIRNTRIIKKTGYQIRRLIVEYENRKQNESLRLNDENIAAQLDSLTVHHYWFDTWADHKCPKDVDALLNLSLDVLEGKQIDFDDDLGDVNIFDCGSSNKSDSSTVTSDVTSQIRYEKELVVQKETKRLVGRKDTYSEILEHPPTVVHCSAGIGRTGCLIAILNGIKQLKSDEKVDILGIVCNMRLNRGGMVQNSEQYELIHKVLCLYEDVYMSSQMQ